MPRYYVITPTTSLNDVPNTVVNRGQSLEWLQEQIGGNIERVVLKQGAVLWVHESGRIEQLPSNYTCIAYLEQTKLCSEHQLLDLMSFTGTIHGTVVLQVRAPKATKTPKNIPVKGGMNKPQRKQK